MRVLVVEDEHKIANSIKRGLELEGFVVDVAYDGEKGYDLAATEPYSVIILDIMLPKMSGLELCSELRKEDNHTPVLMLTAKSQLEDKVKGLEMGADDYLVKPFAFSELIARVKALTRRPGKIADQELKLNDLTLNTGSFKVTRDGKIISLTRKEFSLLKYMLTHKGKVLTKDQLIEHVWNYDADILPNTVEVYIGYLRNKIDKPFPKKKKLIRTVRGFGYRIG